MSTELEHWLKFFYFLNGLVESCWLRFAPIFYTEQKLTSSQIGFLQALGPFLNVIAQVGWGYIADKYHCKKSVWLITTTMNTVILMSLLIPNFITNFSGYVMQQFLGSCFNAPGILAVYVMDLYGEDSKKGYGQVIVYAVVSWGLGALVMSILSISHDLKVNLIAFGILQIILIILTAWKLPSYSPNSYTPIQESKHIHSQEIIFFILNLLFFGCLIGMIDNLLFLFILHDLDGSTLLCGITIIVTVVLEIPIFLHSDYYLKTLDYHGCFFVAYLCYIPRVIGYSLLSPSTKWLILFLELSHGITAALAWIAIIEYGRQRQNQWSNVMMNTIASMTQILGPGIGSLIGGFVMDEYGAVKMYQGAAFVATLCLVYHGIIHIWYKCKGQSIL